MAVVVEGLNIAKRHTKPRPKAGKTNRQPRIQQGGILDVPQPILASNVMVICPHCGKPTRIKHGTAGDGRRVRVCAQLRRDARAGGAQVTDENEQMTGDGRADGAPTQATETTDQAAERRPTDEPAVAEPTWREATAARAG